MAAKIPTKNSDARLLGALLRDSQRDVEALDLTIKEADRDLKRIHLLVSIPELVAFDSLVGL